jgi:nucleoside-diphosphate-sugar epimerase
LIFVTGGTGLVGRAVLRALANAGVPAKALVRGPEQATFVESLGARPVIGLVEDGDAWAAADGAAAIVHAAAILRSAAGPDAFERVNVAGTRHAAARACRLGIPLVHLSSVAVYGDVSEAAAGSVVEERPGAPIPRSNPYARSKRAAEEALREEVARGLRATWLRPGPVYGEGDRLFVPRIAAAARRGWMPLVGRGDGPVPLVHADSVADAVRRALAPDAPRGRAFNIADDGAITAAGILAAAGRAAGRGIRAIRLPERLAIGAAAAGDALLGLLPAGRLPGTLRAGAAYWRGGNPFDSTAARRDLGWDPRVDHAAEIERLVRIGLGRPE